MNQIIPFIDLNLQYKSIKSEIDLAISDVIQKSAFVRGPFVDEFEQTFANFMERDHCVSCANGTDALYIALVALGVSPGDEVIVPAHSWISSSETITQAGAKVVFCDTDEKTFTIDPKDLEAKITSRTVGVIPVHLFGQPADMGAIMAIAQKNNLWVLEDCAQAHLARHDGQLVGTFGNAASFSFYPGKNLGAMGDAGAIITNDAKLADRMRMFAQHGGLTKGDHTIEGINSRMDGLQAAILSVKIAYLKQWTNLRQNHASHYKKLLSSVNEIELPETDIKNEHVWHLFVIKIEERDKLFSFLLDNGIQTVINYKTALPFLPAYKRLNHCHADFPNAFRNQSKILSLPLYPEITEDQINHVVTLIKKYFSQPG